MGNDLFDIDPIDASIEYIDVDEAGVISRTLKFHPNLRCLEMGMYTNSIGVGVGKAFLFS